MQHRENTTVRIEPDATERKHARPLTHQERLDRFADSDRFGDWLAETKRPVTNRSVRQFVDEQGLIGVAS